MQEDYEFEAFDEDVAVPAEDVEPEPEPEPVSSSRTQKIALHKGYRGILVDPDTGERYRRGVTYEVSEDEAERLLSLSGRGGRSPFVKVED